jgi:hypothetical protein
VGLLVGADVGGVFLSTQEGCLRYFQSEGYKERIRTHGMAVILQPHRTPMDGFDVGALVGALEGASVTGGFDGLWVGGEVGALIMGALVGLCD